MRRVAILIALAILATGFWRLESRSTGAQMGAAPVVGSWQVTLTLPGGLPPVRTLSSYTSDGLVFITPPVSRPAPPGGTSAIWFTTTAHGVWQDAGDGTIAVAASNTVTNEMGLPVGIQTIRATVSVDADGQTLRGETTSVLVDLTGAELQTTMATIGGVRIGFGTTAPATPTA
jgi:hypothetical protein